MRRTAVIVVSLLGLTACPESVLPDYEAARQAALRVPVAPPDYQPDAVLHISKDLLQQLVAVGLEERGDLRAGFAAGTGLTRAQVEPHLTMDSMGIQGTARCDSCIAVEPHITGKVDFKTAVGAGSLDVNARGEVDVEIRSEARGGGFVVTGKPVAVHDFTVRLGKSKPITRLLEGPVAERIEARLLQEGKPSVITEFGEDTPLLGVGVVPSKGGLGVTMLTNSPTPGQLASTASRVRSGWQLDLSEQSLVGLAARASFDKGPMAQGIVVVPTTIDFEVDSFTMDVRLWSTTGKGWWRDYTIHGVHRIEGKRLHLAAESVVEGATSKGAVFADPLAALAQSVILSTIEDSVRTAIPAYQSADKGDHTYTVDVQSAGGEVDGVLTLRGSILVSDKAPDRSKLPPR